MSRVRAGDEQAATDLVRQYEPLVRREVRLHLEDRRLSRLFDSLDVCQEVMASFFVRAAAGADALHELAGADPTPSQIVAGRELLDEMRQRLTDEEKQLADLRGQGLGWSEIADQLGGTAQARRVQLARAMDRVLRALGLEEASDG